MPSLVKSDEQRLSCSRNFSDHQFARTDVSPNLTREYIALIDPLSLTRGLFNEGEIIVFKIPFFMMALGAAG